MYYIDYTLERYKMKWILCKFLCIFQTGAYLPWINVMILILKSCGVIIAMG